MKVLIIGAGVAGLMAAGAAAERGIDTTIFEKNEKTGKKIYITGKGRCNVTNDCNPQEFLDNTVNNSKFLHSAIYTFSPSDTIAFLKKNGLNTVTERGNRVFPMSNKASDVIKTLTNYATVNGAKIMLQTEVLSIDKSDGVFKVKTNSGNYIFDKIIVATGGKSYPSTGSTGDGYKIAERFGHTVIKPLPALVGIMVKESYVKELEGLSLKNVSVTAMSDGKALYSEFGEMLFTASGLSGPAILSISSLINRREPSTIKIVIDLKPALDDATLDARILRDFAENANKSFKNNLGALLPKSLIPVVVKLSGIDGEQKVNTISREQRKNLVNLLKNFTFSVKSLGGFEQAVVTSGGVSVKEINPKTMESKLIKGLFFAGEVIDVDAFTGGFNIQIALSTGYAAGKAV